MKNLKTPNISSIPLSLARLNTNPSISPLSHNAHPQHYPTQMLSKVLRRIAPVASRASTAAIVPHSRAFATALSVPVASAAPAARTTSVRAASTSVATLLAPAPVRAFSAAPEAAPVVIIDETAPVAGGFTSHALRENVDLAYRNLPIGERKLDLLCRLVRGLSVREALAQLELSQKKHTYWFRRALENMTRQAAHNFNMAPERLVITTAYCTRGQLYKRVIFQGRGRTGLLSRYHSNLFLSVGEQKYHPREVRIGRYGPTIANLKRVDAVVDAWKARKSAE